MPKHTETLLERLTWSQQGWQKVLSDNMEKLEDTLLYVDGLLDVDITSLADKDILQWNSSSQKFENVPYTDVFPETTLTSLDAILLGPTIRVTNLDAILWSSTTTTTVPGEFVMTEDGDIVTAEDDDRVVVED